MIIAETTSINNKLYVTNLIVVPDADYKTIDNLRLVIQQKKPLYVIKTFLEKAIKGEYYQQIYQVENRYVELLNQNKKVIDIDDSTQVEVIDLENVPEEVLEIEEKFPHLKTFRETLEYTPPEIPDTFIPENFDEYKQLIRQYNRYFHEEFILEQGYKPLNYDFKVYCKKEDLDNVQSALNLAKTRGATTFPLIVYGGEVKELPIDEVEDILTEAYSYHSFVFMRKVIIRENFIKPAEKIEDLVNTIDVMKTLDSKTVLDELASKLGITISESDINLENLDRILMFQ